MRIKKVQHRHVATRLYQLMHVLSFVNINLQAQFLCNINVFFSVERRRRNVINTRIIELRNLLPDHIDRASCKKKGSILKESIEYIKQLREDQKRIKCLQDRIYETEITIFQLVDKFEQLESQISNNITKNEDNEAIISGTSEQSDVVTVYAEDDNVCEQESQSSRSEIARPEQVGHDLNQIWVDISTALTSVSTMSYPICSDIENGAMIYCQMA
ncbi:microphthalmia-associated transcription factor-like [Ruditapes philippinarum]|uniref:microphthalmia-associated transcription factor-like n=1 Tax=Ruditapes philippinarum TaxID=129788 RepID=UPI00295B4374|nr:microphthalmia-associated transcription factor-like [Ruditapes philippinarum]